MTIPSTGPLPTRRVLTVRRDRRPDALLVAAALTTVAIVVLVLSSAAVGELTGARLVVCFVLMTVAVLCVTAAAWLMRPHPLPPIIEYEPVMPTVGPPGVSAVSPDPDRGSWPFSPPPPPPYEPGNPR